MSEEELPPTPMQVITVVIDDGLYPRVDLGTIHPALAASILREVVRALEDMIPPPEITYDNELVYAIGDDEDDED